MSESFSMAIKKHKSTTIGQVQGHNNRTHVTTSQLPVVAWITPEGRHEIMPFNPDLIAKSKALAKRKDAVLAVELVVQVGNQTDWREMPTPEHPHGKRKSGSSARLNAIMAGVKAAAIAEFGQERIIGVDLHTDESTPHAHIVFAPIHDGKLQAKHWLNGAASCAALREKIHSHVAKHIECDYEKGALGGAPHDPSKAAGGINAPKPEPGFLEKTADKLTGSSAIKQLKVTISDLNQQLQNMFSKLKNAEKRASDEVELREKAIKKAHEVQLLVEKQKLEIKDLQLEIEVLQPKPLPKPEKQPEQASKTVQTPVSRPKTIKP